MYVGRKHTVTATAKQVLPFQCKHCGHHTEAYVVGVGQGTGNSPYFLDERGASERATSSAQSSAGDNARLTLSLARCPRCDKRDESAVTALKLKVFAGAVAVLVIFPVFGLVLDSLRRSSFGIWIFAPLGVVTAWFIFSSQKWKWETVDGRVAFVDDLDREGT